MRDDDETARRPTEGAGADGPLRLVLYTPAGVLTHTLPASGAVRVGRSPEAEVSVRDPELSRFHVALHVGSPLCIEDLGSSNGTRLEGRALRRGELTPLAPGRSFELGGTFGMVQPVGPTRPAASAEEVLRDAAPPEAGMRASVVVADPAMRSLHQMVARVAVGEISVLLLGETGVGKEVFAERIHQLSPRARGPFARLNCAALSEGLIDSELFGHEKGAFTGAMTARPGLLESAAGGTVFLDEVGELPASVQVRLLRVLEERKVLPVGGRQPRPIDVRVVSATHRDLEAEIAAGRFRADLWFRLNGVSLVVPPLRARGAEVEPLARLFLAEACARSKLPAPSGLSVGALDALRRWSWPGNLRELRNVMERAALMAAGEPIELEHLPDPLRAPPQASAGPPTAPSTAPPRATAGAGAAGQGTLRSAVEELERERIIAALTECSGNQTRAAALLGMPRRTFVFKLARYGLNRATAGK